jgi:hypothetical protein
MPDTTPCEQSAVTIFETAQTSANSEKGTLGTTEVARADNNSVQCSFDMESDKSDSKKWRTLK